MCTEHWCGFPWLWETMQAFLRYENFNPHDIVELLSWRAWTLNICIYFFFFRDVCMWLGQASYEVCSWEWLWPSSVLASSKVLQCWGLNQGLPCTLHTLCQLSYISSSRLYVFKWGHCKGILFFRVFWRLPAWLLLDGLRGKWMS